MKIAEYERIKELSYREYCEYLQSKYGLPLCDYTTGDWKKNVAIERSEEGLTEHHIYEDCAPMLSIGELARNRPQEWQKAENIVYCDYLELLLLHILICESKGAATDFGGGIGVILSRLNDVYSGWVAESLWRRQLHQAVLEDKETYFALLKRVKGAPYYREGSLLRSWNASHGSWDIRLNRKLFEEIEGL